MNDLQRDFQSTQKFSQQEEAHKDLQHKQSVHSNATTVIWGGSDHCAVHWNQMSCHGSDVGPVDEGDGVECSHEVVQLLHNLL